ncbi:hypothetical protein [Bacillus mycoides]|uniref:hypothetical protein n=1 Tax=Bacillus mycoides TaxID=1405 RepID=UPI001C039600|nr:hypothetical protein [Bacillus mycoides]
MSAFRTLVSLVNEYLEGYTNLSEEEVKNRIQDAYEDDEIDGGQYDHLIGIME